MDPEFWRERWQQGQIGFHRDTVHPLLVQHRDALPALAGSRVLVPLCGKSLDLVWLEGHGYEVLGVELSSLAVRDFFAEHGRKVSCERDGAFERHRSGKIEILCGDFFALSAAQLGLVHGVYDRAALIALPEPLRTQYVERLSQLLPHGSRGLLITLESSPHEPSGPPFSVDEAAVRGAYEPSFVVKTLHREDVLEAEPRFKARGITALYECAYALERR
jgi:thiopurine S-methyltransferase